MENLNIFSSKGFITRSGFFAAYLIIGLIASFFSMTGSVFAIGIFKSVNLLCCLIAIIGCLLCSYFTFANLIKRFCDIKEKKLCIVSYLFLYIISFLDASCYFGGYLNNEKLLTVLFYYHIVFFLFVVVLSFIKGQNKTNYPPFNFAAFFGTVIWGLFNKCFISLIFIFHFLLSVCLYFLQMKVSVPQSVFNEFEILFILRSFIAVLFSLSILKFMIVMGILGNRLIKNYNPKIQKIQTSVFAVLFFLSIIAPYTYLQYIAIKSPYQGWCQSILNYNSPDNKVTLLAPEEAYSLMENVDYFKYDNLLKQNVKVRDYKKINGEYIFYIDKADWDNFPLSLKLLYETEMFAYAYYRESTEKLELNYIPEFQNKVKVYSVDNEVLFETKVDDSVIKNNLNFFEFIKLVRSIKIK